MVIFLMLAWYGAFWCHMEVACIPNLKCIWFVVVWVTYITLSQDT